MFANSKMVSYEADTVLSKTFNLLGLSMIPTVLAAYLVSLIPLTWYAQHAGLALCVFLANFIFSLGIMFYTFKARNEKLALIGFGLFTISMGAGLGPTIMHYANLHNGPQIIFQALAATGVTFFGLSAYAYKSKKDFSYLGGFLFAGLIVIIVAGILNIFFHSSIFSLAISVVSAFIFMGYILYDISRIVNGGETNYVFAAISLYLDILNLFLDLLKIFGFLSSDD